LGPWHLKYYSTTVTPNTPYLVATAVGNVQACTSPCTAPEGTQTPAIYLNPGRNTLTVKCATYTYIFHVYRLSDDATLSNLVCDTALTPAWDPYWAIPWQSSSYAGFVTTVTWDTAAFKCRPTRSQATPVPRYGSIQQQSTSVPGDPLKTVATNTLFTWPLTTGRNLFQIFVTAEYTSSVAYYNVLVHRLSHDSSLASLTTNGVTISPTFRTGTLVYNATVAASVSTIVFTPTFNCQLRSSVFENFLVMHCFRTGVLIVCVCGCVCVCVCVSSHRFHDWHVSLCRLDSGNDRAVAMERMAACFNPHEHQHALIGYGLWGQRVPPQHHCGRWKHDALQRDDPSAEL
jgi:hypothetical protein